MQEVRGRFAAGRERAAARFRQAFAADTSLPPNERWRAHLEIQAASLLEELSAVSLDSTYRIAVIIDENHGRRTIPLIVASTASPPALDQADKLTPDAVFYPYFRVEQSAVGVFEFFLFTSEVMGSSNWQVTRVIADHDEYNELLAKMESPQIVNALFSSFEPAVEFRADGTSMLDVTLYTRAQEERIERRSLSLDQHQEFHFHSRALIAEGRGGVTL